MSRRKVILVDVDLTVVNPVVGWVGWYHNLTGHDIEDDMKDIEWNVDSLMHYHPDPLSYWKKPDLYDEMVPYPDAVKVLTALSSWCDIVFVSHCFPEHETSKRFFCQRNFPFMSGFISTKEKKYVKGDFFIDDLEKNLKDFIEHQPDSFVYKIKSQFNGKGDIPQSTWDDIGIIILKKVVAD